VIRHLVNLLLFCWPPSRFFGCRRLLLRIAGVNIKNNVKFCGRSWIYGRGVVNIERNTWLSPGVVIHSHEDVPISIGANCDIGPGVEFIPGGHVIGDPIRRAGEGTAGAIALGEGCWIGARTIILGGVSIGAGCVIAAGSVVTQSVPPNSLVAGVPARIKRQLSP